MFCTPFFCILFCLWWCCLVSLHICKASRRSSKFCLPVADLHLSSFLFLRLPSTTLRSCLLLSPRALLSSSRLPRVAPTCIFLFCLPIYESSKIVRKKNRKNRRVSDLLSSFSFFFFLFIVLCFVFSSSQIFCLRVMRAGHSSGIVLFSECQMDSFLITAGLNFCGCLGRALGRDKRVALPLFQSSSSWRSFESFLSSYMIIKNNILYVQIFWTFLW